jgi:hypothetical protein
MWYTNIGLLLLLLLLFNHSITQEEVSFLIVMMFLNLKGEVAERGVSFFSILGFYVGEESYCDLSGFDRVR